MMPNGGQRVRIRCRCGEQVALPTLQFLAPLSLLRLARPCVRLR